MESAKISLNVIMKNESRVLPRMLESVWPLLDYYVVIDTGSTDNSKQIVKDFFDSKNIPGEIHDHPFVDFEDARNFAIQKVKNKADFGFWIDCDEELNIPSSFNIIKFKNELKNVDSGVITVSYGGQRYSRCSFFKTSKRYRWTGKVHEVIVCDDHTINMGIPELTILVHPDGNSWQPENIKDKYLTHARILEKEVNEKNDPRDIFYLAQSLRDAGEGEKSREWYRKRVLRDDGFYEEKYYAQFTIGNLTVGLNESIEKVLIEYMKAHEIDSLRGEHILNLIIQLQNSNMWQTAYIFSKYAIDKYHGKNPYPERQLFIDQATYIHKIKDVHAVNCQRTGNEIEVSTPVKIKTIEQDFKITFAFILHDKEVCNNYLYPSYNNMVIFNNKRHLIKSILEPSVNGNPAKNYNTLINRADTDYIIFTHGDVTFGQDFCERIFGTIKEVPDFGALGIVGVDGNRNYLWAKGDKIQEVETLDCCCILINKKHGLLFDEKTFDDFHLYVEDYCTQVKEKGLKCYTVMVNASEKEPTSYPNMLPFCYNFFHHHSVTMGERGACWGRYNEYKERLNKKWNRLIQTT